jgi:hypothetical protein
MTRRTRRLGVEEELLGSVGGGYLISEKKADHITAKWRIEVLIVVGSTANKGTDVA